MKMINEVDTIQALVAEVLKSDLTNLQQDAAFMAEKGSPELIKALRKVSEFYGGTGLDLAI